MRYIKNFSVFVAKHKYCKVSIWVGFVEVGKFRKCLMGIWVYSGIFDLFTYVLGDHLGFEMHYRNFLGKLSFTLQGVPKVTMSAILTPFFVCWLNGSSPMGVGEMVCGTFLKHLGRPKLLWRNFCSWPSRPVINPGFMGHFKLLKGMLRLLPLIDRLNNFDFWLA